MSDFNDIGRLILEATITAHLGDAAKHYDVVALVNAYVERFGWVDLGEVDEQDFEILASQHTLN